MDPTNRHINVVLNLPTAHPALLLSAKRIYQSMLGNAHFATPDPALALLLAAINAFDATLTAKGPDAGTLRKEARAALVAILKHLRDYVQGIAEQATTDPTSTVESAGMSVRKSGARIKAAFAVKQGGVVGLVLLIARAAAVQATYYWEYSLDQKAWAALPDTMKAKTQAPGLTPGQMYYFRFQALTRAGLGDYSQTLSLLVK